MYGSAGAVSCLTLTTLTTSASPPDFEHPFTQAGMFFGYSIWDTIRSHAIDPRVRFILITGSRKTPFMVL